MYETNDGGNSIGTKGIKDEIQGRLFYSPPKQNGNNNMADGCNTLSQNNQTTQTQEDTLPPESVKRTAEIIAKDIVKHVAFAVNSRPADKYCETMRRTVSELSERHEILLKSMVMKLNITEKNGYHTFVNVADEIFADGTVNWGRIVSLYAFSARLAAYSVESDLAAYTDCVADFTGKYVANKLSGWIHENGGWVG